MSDSATQPATIEEIQTQDAVVKSVTDQHVAALADTVSKKTSYQDSSQVTEALRVQKNAEIQKLKDLIASLATDDTPTP